MNPELPRIFELLKKMKDSCPNCKIPLDCCDSYRFEIEKVAINICKQCFIVLCLEYIRYDPARVHRRNEVFIPRINSDMFMIVRFLEKRTMQCANCQIDTNLRQYFCFTVEGVDLHICKRCLIALITGFMVAHRAQISALVAAFGEVSHTCSIKGGKCRERTLSSGKLARHLLCPKGKCDECCTGCLLKRSDGSFFRNHSPQNMCAKCGLRFKPIQPNPSVPLGYIFKDCRHHREGTVCGSCKKRNLMKPPHIDCVDCIQAKLRPTHINQ